MPTIALEGTGATIGFGSSTVTSDLISLTLPERAREVIETTHLGTVGAKTFKPAKLINPGTVSAEFDHNPAADRLIDNSPEVITITYPLGAGEATAAKLVFTGFVTQEGGEEFRVDQRMTTKVTIQITGPITYTPAEASTP